PQVLEQAVRHVAVFEPALDQPPGVEVAASGQRDEALRVRAQLLRLRLRGHDLVVAKETGREIGEQRLLVARGAGELPTFGPMPHYSPFPSLTCACGGIPGSSTFHSSPVSSNFIPKLSPSRRSSSAISPSAFSPTFLTLRRSSSRYCTRSPSVRMFEFLRELTERTDNPTSSIERARSSRSRVVGRSPLSGAAAGTIGTLPKSTKKRKCSWARAAAYATASSVESV